MIAQGDLYWVELDGNSSSDGSGVRPCVVIQSDLVNQSRIKTVVVCALTSIMKRGLARGNVVLNAGEGNLPAASVANVSQIFTVSKAELDDKIGTLSPHRVRQILAGVRQVIEPTEPDDRNGGE